MDLTPFERALGIQRRITAKERLHELRHKYALTDTDPLWDVLALVEDFCANLAEDATAPAAPPSAASPTPPRALRWEDKWRIAVLCAAAAAAQTCLLAASFAAGMRTVGADDWVSASMRAPAGYVVLLLLLPLFIAISCLGFRERHREPTIGWCCFIGGSVAAGALCYVLWQIL